MTPRINVQRLVSLGIKYAPVAYQGIKHGRAPAEEFARRQVSRRTARTLAVEHAEHLVDGSVLPVFDGDTRVWVVFSGDEPVATHPVVRTPLEQLLRHFDLGKRMTPAQARASARRRARRTARDAAVGEPARALPPGPPASPPGGDASGPGTSRSDPR